jgi:OmpA-OmpF porin, OOP family
MRIGRAGFTIMCCGTLLGLAGCSKVEDGTKPGSEASAAPAVPTDTAAPALAPQSAVAPTSSPTAAAAASTGPVADFIALKPAGAVPVSSGRAPSLPGDAANTHDHPAVGRYQGSRIVEWRQKQYDAAKLFHGVVAESNKADLSTYITAEGRVTQLVYEAPKDRSSLEVFRSYQKALADAGFETAFSCTPEDCKATVFAMKGQPGMPGYNITNDNHFALAAFRRSDGVRLNLAVAPYGAPRIMLLIVEPAAMEQGVKVVDAAGIGRDIAQQGRALLYAIQFDTDKAVLKPESDAQLKEIADWLKGSGAKALVVGHTDSQGAFPYNVGLSQRRAEAVVAALTARYAVPKAQLTAFGNGMAAPVASNRNPDGQARNRRVEVVEMVS